MALFPIILLAVAVSIDGFGVGIAFGLGKMKLLPLSLLLLGLASGTAMLISMTVGSVLSRFFSPALTSRAGALLLIGFGILMLAQQWQPAKNSGLLGMLSEPSRADWDRSGTINLQEGAVLGLALAMDAFGAGFGAAMAGFPPLATAVAVAVAKVMLVGGGFVLGAHISASNWSQKLRFLPGIIICGLGVAKFILV